MIDTDLAELYGVGTKALNQAVKRNLSRFPEDFMFRLSKEEFASLNRSQIVTGSQRHRDPRFIPYAFTEHGALMLSSVLKSPRASEISVFIVRAFVRLREILATHKDLATKMQSLEYEQAKQGQQLAKVARILKQLLDEPVPNKDSIGFKLK